MRNDSCCRPSDQFVVAGVGLAVAAEDGRLGALVELVEALADLLVGLLEMAPMPIELPSTCSSSSGATSRFSGLRTILSIGTTFALFLPLAFGSRL